MTTKNNIIPSSRHHIHSFRDCVELMVGKGLTANPDLSTDNDEYSFVCSHETTGLNHNMILVLNKKTGTLIVNTVQ